MPSLGKSLPYLAYPVLGLLAGWASTTVLPSGKANAASSNSSSATSPTTAPSREPRDASSPPMTADELFAEAKRIVEGPDESAIATYLTDWNDAEILAALNEAAVAPDAMLRHESMATGLLREFAKRDPERALRWSLGQSDIMRQRFATIALSGWLPDREDDAIAIVKKHPDVFGGQLPPQILQACIASASAKGTAAFITRLGELKALDPGQFLDLNARLDPNLDFAAVLNSPDFAALDAESLKQSMLRTWATRDREAAFQWVLDEGGPTAIFQLQKARWQANHAQASEMIRWMVGKAESYSPEQQAEFLKAQAAHIAVQPDNATVWIQAAKNPEMRDAFRKVAAMGVFDGEEAAVERGLKAVATLDDPAARLAMLESFSRDASPYPERGMELAAQKLLLAKLAEWGADPTRAKAIIDRLYPASADTSSP